MDLYSEKDRIVGEMFEHIGSLKTVSYTHLDVYKRQAGSADPDTVEERGENQQ